MYRNCKSKRMNWIVRAPASKNHIGSTEKWKMEKWVLNINLLQVWNPNWRHPGGTRYRIRIECGPRCSLVEMKERTRLRLRLSNKERCDKTRIRNFRLVSRSGTLYLCVCFFVWSTFVNKNKTWVGEMTPREKSLG